MSALKTFVLNLNFLELTYEKIEADIFIGLQILKLMMDRQFENRECNKSFCNSMLKLFSCLVSIFSGTMTKFYGVGVGAT